LATPQFQILVPTDASTVAERDVQDILEIVELGEGAKAKDKDTFKRR
jgi:hypothetical protein